MRTRGSPASVSVSMPASRFTFKFGQLTGLPELSPHFGALAKASGRTNARSSWLSISRLDFRLACHTIQREGTQPFKPTRGQSLTCRAAAAANKQTLTSPDMPVSGCLFSNSLEVNDAANQVKWGFQTTPCRSYNHRPCRLCLVWKLNNCVLGSTGYLIEGRISRQQVFYTRVQLTPKAAFPRSAPGSLGIRHGDCCFLLAQRKAHGGQPASGGWWATWATRTQYAGVFRRRRGCNGHVQNCLNSHVQHRAGYAGFAPTHPPVMSGESS